MLTAAAALPRLRLSLAAGVLVMAAIVAPAFVTGEALLRHAYAAAAVCIGLVWVDKNPRAFLAFAMFLFLFTPFARRVIDLHAGYAGASTALLAPYLVLLLAAPYCLAHVLSGRRHAAELAVMFLALAAGFGIGLLGGRIGDASVAMLRWVTPLFLLGYMLQKGEGRLAEDLLPPMTVFGLAAAAYALIQFALVPPWDAYWVEMSPITSIGPPVPFEVRVFGTMNSPGSLATALGFIAMLLIASGRAWLGFGAVLILLAMPLTMQRAVAGGIVLGIALLAAFGEARLRARIFGWAAAFAVAAGLASVAAGFSGERIVERFRVGSDLAEDGSLRERSVQYELFPAWMEADPFGRGFGWRAAFDLASAEGPRVVLDSGLLDTWLTLGIIGGTLYLGALGSLVLAAIARGRGGGGLKLGAACAAVTILIQLPLGANQIGEFGFFAFLALGLALAPERQS